MSGRQGLQRAWQQSQRRSRLQQPVEPQLSGRKRGYQQLNEVRAEVPAISPQCHETMLTFAGCTAKRHNKR